MIVRAHSADGGWKGVARSLRRTVRRTRHRLRGGSVILLYHRVAEGIPDPWSLCVGPANFAAQMAVLAARGVRSLDALVDEPGNRRREPVVTFDDGYADFHSAALPVLRAYDVPATLFVTTGTLGGGREFWWDELERILASATLPPSLATDLGGSPFEWTFASDGDRRTLYHALHQRVGRLPGPTRLRVLDALARWAGVAPECRATHRPLGEAEVAAVAREARIGIGAHTVSHSYLGALPATEQQREIDESRRTLETITGRKLRHFSYPHGDHEPETIEAVRRAGFASACGTSCEPVVGAVDRFDLPRIEVPNLSGPAFARWLDEWGG